METDALGCTINRPLARFVFFFFFYFHVNIKIGCTLQKELISTYLAGRFFSLVALFSTHVHEQVLFRSVRVRQGATLQGDLRTPCSHH